MAEFLEARREMVGREKVVDPVDLYPHALTAAGILLALFLLV